MNDKIAAAVRLNEIGDASPYQLSFAGIGVSGASFGFTQSDVHTNLNGRLVLSHVLQQGGVPNAGQVLDLLSRVCLHNPLDAGTTALVNSALNSAAGRRLVDEIDQENLQVVYRGVDACLKVRPIDPESQLYAALWINMTGTPTTLLTWLEDNPTGAVLDYLAAQGFEKQHPQNLDHLKQVVGAMK